MHDFNDIIKSTGALMINVPNVRSIEEIQSSRDEQIKMLNEAGGQKKHKPLKYGVFPAGESKNCYNVRYYEDNGVVRKPGEHAEKILREIESSECHFGILPTHEGFTDDLYWEKMQNSCDKVTYMVYPADLPGSILKLCPDFPETFNLSKLDAANDLLRALLPHLNVSEIEGYTTPALYVGKPGSSFFLHTEDMNLGSLNFLISGAPKVWYIIPTSDYEKVVELVKKLFPDNPVVGKCPQAIQHKCVLIHPDRFREAGIICSRIIQRAGNLMITYPGAHHFGYNTGYNIAEATNYSTREWYTSGAANLCWKAGKCNCKRAPRFYFERKKVEAGLRKIATDFGMNPQTLEPILRKRRYSLVSDSGVDSDATDIVT